MKKKKISIDFLASAYELLAKKTEKESLANSKVINELVITFLGLPINIKKELYDFCLEKYMNITELPKGGGSFTNDSVLIERVRWKNLVNFFSLSSEESIQTKNARMKKLMLNRGCVQVPDDWIYLEGMGRPEEFEYMGVVEVKNDTLWSSDGQPIPHFIFPTNAATGGGITDEEEIRILDCIAKIYPDIRRIKNMQPDWSDVDYKTPEGRDKAKKLNELPDVGLFIIPEKGDPGYWAYDEEYIPPYNAMIIR